MKQILLVEDDQSIISNLTMLLHQEGFAVTTATGQQVALNCLQQGQIDLILLDVTLPDGSGFAVCTAAKRLGNTPVIFLSASIDEVSVVTGLDLGGDDYIAKPFRPMELISRIKSALRKTEKLQNSTCMGDLQIDTIRGTVTKQSKEVFLSALEYRLLLIFFNHKGTVLSRNRLLENLWDIAGEFVNDNTLTVYIKRLRGKIEDDPSNPMIIKTVRGLGYRYD